MSSGCQDDRSPPSSTEDKSVWICTSTPLIRRHDVTRDNLNYFVEPKCPAGVPKITIPCHTMIQMNTEACEPALLFLTHLLTEHLFSMTFLKTR